jgi:hypothetical protein
VLHSRLVDYREGEASALQLAGRIALSAGETAHARVAFERSLMLCRQIGHRAGTAVAMDGLAEATAAADGDAGGVEADRLRAAASRLRAEIGVPAPLG